MKGLGIILSGLPRWRRRTKAAPGVASSSLAHANGCERTVARGLAQALDRAMELELWEHAERVARSAARLARFYPMLGERLARLRLVRGDADTALNIIDACAAQPSSLRLLRAICLIQLGRRLEAHIDLQGWARRSAAPLQARVMLGLLEWQAGDAESAISALLRNLRQLEDPRTLAALTLINCAQQRPSLVEHWANRLRTALAGSHGASEYDLMLRAIGLRGVDQHAHCDEIHIATLAMELLANEPVIPALATALFVRPEAEDLRIVRAAIESIVDDLDDFAAGCEALARLALAADDVATARNWLARAVDAAPNGSSPAQPADEREAARDTILATIGPKAGARERAA